MQHTKMSTAQVLTKLLSRMSKPFWFTHQKPIELDNTERNAFKSLDAWGLERGIEVK